MHDPRTRTALRQLADLGPRPDPPRWVWAFARPDREGRLRRPGDARRALDVRAGHGTEVRGICHRVALVVRTAGASAPLVVESRGRLSLPVWLRRGGVGSLVVGVDVGARLVVIATTSVLDGLGDFMVGASR